MKIPKSIHYPFFNPQYLCLHCGEPVMHDEKSGVWIHDWKRYGENDNGYWCKGVDWQATGKSAYPDVTKTVIVE